MINGAVAQHRSSLSFVNNPGGIGTVTTWADRGAHKMSHTAFDSSNFVEVLAVVSGGNWVRSWHTSGAAFTASEVFGVDAIDGLNMTTNAV